MTTNPHTYTRVRTEQRALLAEIDQLAQGSTTPISLDAIAALAIPAGGSLHAQPAPIRALPHVLRCLEQKGLVTVDRNGRSWSNGSLDWSKSTATVTAAGRTLLRPNPAKRLDTPITPPPTWRGDCMRERADSSPFDALQRPPVLRRGAEDFRACASRGM